MTVTMARADLGRAARLRSVLPDRSDVPRWICVVAVLAAAGTVWAFLMLAAAAGTVRTGFDTIGTRTAPQVAATEDLYFALADMDAQLANIVLAGGDPALTKTRDDALAEYEKRRLQADADLQQATMVAGADESAQATIRDILDRLGRYEASAAETMLRVDLARDAAGMPSSEVLASYRAATDLMGPTLESAHQLTITNGAALESSYQDTEYAAESARIWLMVHAVVVLGALIALQVLLRVKTHRRLNPALIVATALAGGLIVGGFAAMGVASDDLRVAKKDAFDSLLALRQARAVSYDANADESRYLVDPVRAARYEQAFLDKSNALADVHADRTSAYPDALDAALRAYRTNNTDKGIGGFFGTELHNITFTGEGAAATQTITAFQQYQQDDRVIRRLAQTDRRAAITMTTGTSNEDFRHYDDALSAVIDINQRAFDSEISAGRNATGGWNGVLPYGGALIVVVLIGAGVAPRLAEYR
ncbi:hypothetical protein ABZ942_15645 [Nocardia sp. NPDC046473]|uniref:hypothetical protein n=1 Tax=Nocardia sp. NPDC046473 TaxID=3155733 RepID=UPI0033E486AB